MASVELVPATEADKPVLRRLLQLYLHDLSPFDGNDVDDHGEYSYPYLDHYWTPEERDQRHPFLFRISGRWAGFALVRAGRPHEMAEFFVLRKYRRTGVGTELARRLFARFPGEWSVLELPGHDHAVRFWRRAIPYPLEETVDERGTTQRFVVPERQPGQPNRGAVPERR